MSKNAKKTQPAPQKKNSSLIAMIVVLVAVVFCFIIGVIFGLYPANKAARMKPIDALHYGG